MATRSYREHIRDVLDQSPDLLTAREIAMQLRKRGVTISGSRAVITVLKEGEAAGLFIRHEDGGRLEWTNAALWPGEQPAAPAAAAVDEDAPAAPAAAAADAEQPFGIGFAIGLGTRPAPAPRNEVTDPCGLVSRLDAITQDIEQAIEDACDRELSHSLIKHLVNASTAARHARRVLAH